MKTIICAISFLCSSIFTQAQWNTPVTIESSGDDGWSNSLHIVEGNPAVSYYDVTNGDLKYARATDATGGTWGTPIAVETSGDVGRFTSLAIADGNPAIAYYDNGNDDLKYIRATDANGNTWGTSLTLDATGDVGRHLSLEIINDNPAISYRDVTNGDLKYIRANDSSGNSWGTPIVVDNGSNTGWHNSLEVVNGNPAIAYWNHQNDDLYYVRANDVSGNAWGTPIEVDATGNVGGFSHLAIVNGNPAIGYLDATNDKLKFARADDANGSTWSSLITLSETGNIGGNDVVLVVVAGNPAMCYYDNVNQQTKYVYANDINGNTWNSPEVVVSGGAYYSMLVVAGNPAISYFTNDANRDMNYIRSDNTTGLPVELLSFTATADKTNNNLNWQTASEYNNGGFDIERSLNGKEWERIGFITGRGTTHEISHYNYKDYHPFEGLNYYRLKQIDFDGQFEYSKIINVSYRGGNFEMTLYPNPVQDGELIIHFPNIKNSTATTKLYNLSGQLVLNQTAQIINGKIVLSVDEFPKGIYVIESEFGQHIVKEKILVF